MASKIIKLFITIFFFINNIYSQAPSIEWQKCYGGTGNQDSQYLLQTSDGGYIACCYSFNPGIEYKQFWIKKLNPTGTLLWEKYFGGTGDDYASCIQQTIDGGYIVVGFTNSNDGQVTNNHGNYDYWIVKLNSSGDIIWQKTFGGSGEDRAWFVQQTTDNGYIIAGESGSANGDVTNNHGMKDYWVLKLNVSGDLIWQKSFGGSNEDNGYCIKQTVDGGYILSGIANSWDGDVTNPAHILGKTWIVKLNNVGNIDWENTYGSNHGGESSFVICQTNDGGYCFAGASFENSGDVTGNHGSLDFWIVRLNTIGGIIWQKSLGGADFDIPTSIFSKPDGGFTIGGWTRSLDGDVIGNHGADDYWLVNLSSSGVLQWQKTIGGTQYDQSISMCQTADGGYAMTGHSSSDNSGDVGPNTGGLGTNDMWIVKLSQNIVPVILSDFGAEIKSKNIVCSWKTQQEQNGSHFIVERSDDAVHFISLGRIPAKGTSTTPVEYEFVDKNAISTEKKYLYYRLKMVDIDGSFEYSNTVSIKFEYPVGLSAYPNPVSDFMTIDLTSSIYEISPLVIYDCKGKKVMEKLMTIYQGINKITVTTSWLSSGCYFLSINGKNHYSFPFIKVVK